MLPSGWTRIDQDRFKLAVEALRKARATYECAYGPGEGEYSGYCEFAQRAPSDSETVPDSGPYWTIENVHAWHASALLDGFSVDEITAAEEALA